jgi:hypothetical protein
MLEIFRMYNSFAKRETHVILDASAYHKIVELYEQGLMLVIVLIIEAYNQASSDPRRDITHTIPVFFRRDENMPPEEFLVVCSLTNQYFRVYMIVEPPSPHKP